jgi:hypothetical protein
MWTIKNDDEQFGSTQKYISHCSGATRPHFFRCKGIDSQADRQQKHIEKQSGRVAKGVFFQCREVDKLPELLGDKRWQPRF